MSNMAGPYTDRLRKLIHTASDIAKSRDNNWIGVEHILEALKSPKVDCRLQLQDAGLVFRGAPASAPAMTDDLAAASSDTTLDHQSQG